MSSPSAARVARLGPVDRIAPGQGFCFVVGGEEIAVFRLRDGKVYAVQNRCPHKNAPLAEGIAGGAKVICPFHARKFDLCTGQGDVSGERLRTWPVEVKDGEILLMVEGP